MISTYKWHPLVIFDELSYIYCKIYKIWTCYTGTPLYLRSNLAKIKEHAAVYYESDA